MKKLLLTAAAVMVAVGVYAQGTVNFANITFTAPLVDAPVFNTDGTPLQGANFMAQLYFGVSGTTDAGSLSAVGAAPAAFTLGPGYWNGGTRSLTGIAGGDAAAVQVRAWDMNTGGTWETATVRGESAIFEVTTANPNAQPPGIPTNLGNLQSFSLVPEPSTFALGLIGAGALFFARRRK